MRTEELKLIIENLKNGRWTIPVSHFLLKEAFDSERSAYWENIFQGFQENQFNSSQAIFALSEIEKQLLVAKGNKTANLSSFFKFGLFLT